MPPKAEMVGKQYANKDYPRVILRFEDGHEIKVYQGNGKSFDAYAGEHVKILAMYDPTTDERELVGTKKSDDFEDAAADTPA